MEDKRPLVSICIPTYNRAELLTHSLEAYIGSDAFDEDVEIVISDNCSTDNTQSVGEKYASKYPNIKYFRNKENIRDANFSLALDRGTGHYLKLMNDNFFTVGDGLAYLKNCVSQHKEDRTPLLFTNGILFNSPKVDSLMCNSFDEFIIHTTYCITSIYFFGCWREMWSEVVERDKYSKLQLSQDDWLYQIVERYHSILLCSQKYCTAVRPKKYSGYNWFEIHVDNYYKILQPYVDKGVVTAKALSKERITYLKGLRPWILMTYIYKFDSSFQFDTSNASSILWKYYKKEPRFYWLMVTLPFWGIWKAINKKMKK